VGLLYCKFPEECDSEKILKIGQYLTTLCVDYVGLLFWPTLYYFLSLTLPAVCLFVTLLKIDSSFLFLDGIEPFLAVSSSFGTPQYKCCSSIFDLGP